VKSNGSFLAIAFLALLLVPWGQALAAPLPPMMVVNHDTRQCSSMFAGDECMDCFPPEGWESLGFDGECPADYEVIDKVDYTCQAFKIQRCCSEGHSGAPGDCEDLAVNDKAKQCAFVEDIHGCTLPKGWSSRPDQAEPRSWVCPANHEWVQDLKCVTETSLPADAPDTKGTSVPCLGAILIGPAVMFLWLLTNRGH
jgi:hypothetical protein